MKRKLASVGIFSFAILCGLVVSPGSYGAAVVWPKEQFSSECAKQARTMKLRKVSVEPAKPVGDGGWEAIVNATDQAGRDARLRCSYDPRLKHNRVTVDRLER
jgi:hypothetical protein